MQELMTKPQPADDHPLAAEEPKPEESRWGFEQGDEIAPGRSAIKLLGGGYRYEAYLAWSERLRSLVVTKVVRPGLVEDERTLRGLADEVEFLERLSHPVLVRSFGHELEGTRPHLVLEHLEGPRLRGRPLRAVCLRVAAARLPPFEVVAREAPVGFWVAPPVPFASGAVGHAP